MKPPSCFDPGFSYYRSESHSDPEAFRRRMRDRAERVKKEPKPDNVASLRKRRREPPIAGEAT